MLSDTHCHLDFDVFDIDRDLVIEKARQNEVKFILNPGINTLSSQKAVKLAGMYPEVYAAVGVHPNDALSWGNEDLRELEGLTFDRKVIAIGEIGLDYYREKSPRSLQMEIFQVQLDLAAKRNLPIIIHTRNVNPDDNQAIEDALAVIQSWRKNLGRLNNRIIENSGVMHSFSGDVELAMKALDMNLMIGLSGPITFKNASNLVEIVKSLPLESILLETDSPFLTPHPNRGKRNDPSNVKFIARKIAEITDLAYDFVINTTLKNSERMFKWQATL